MARSARCATWPSADVAQLVARSAACRAGSTPARSSTHSTGRCAPARADADQRGAAHVGMRVEHRLDLLGVQRRRRVDDHALRLAPAEPQPALRRRTSRGRPCGARCVRCRRPVRLADLRQRRRGVATEVGVGGGRTGDGDLADLARLHEQRVGPFGDRVVVDADDADLVRRAPGGRRRCRRRARWLRAWPAVRGLRSPRPAGIRWRRRASRTARRRAAARACARRRRPAPARRRTVTRLTVGKCAPWRASTAISAGEPNNCVDAEAFDRLQQRARIGAAPAASGSMSGMIDVRPSAGSNSANGGNVGRSTPPGSHAERIAQHARPARRNGGGGTPRPWARRSSRW